MSLKSKLYSLIVNAVGIGLWLGLIARDIYGLRNGTPWWMLIIDAVFLAVCVTNVYVRTQEIKLRVRNLESLEKVTRSAAL